jgi:hypothetical protein
MSLLTVLQKGFEEGEVVEKEGREGNALRNVVTKRLNIGPCFLPELETGEMEKKVWETQKYWYDVVFLRVQGMIRDGKDEP